MVGGEWLHRLQFAFIRNQVDLRRFYFKWQWACSVAKQLGYRPFAFSRRPFRPRSKNFSTKGEKQKSGLLVLKIRARQGEGRFLRWRQSGCLPSPLCDMIIKRCHGRVKLNWNPMFKKVYKRKRIAPKDYPLSILSNLFSIIKELRLLSKLRLFCERLLRSWRRVLFLQLSIPVRRSFRYRSYQG